MLLHKEEIAHPCFPDEKRTTFEMIGPIVRNSYFTPGKLESQLNPAKVARFDPHGVLRGVMVDCLKFDPSERPEMADICARLC